MYKTLILSVILISVFFGVASVKAQNSSASKTAQTKGKKLKIIRKPVPFTDGNCEGSEGLVVVRATFDKSGKITAVEMVRASACSYFNEQVLIKARQIKFEPQVENGEPVTVVKTIEYKFAKY